MCVCVCASPPHSTMAHGDCDRNRSSVDVTMPGIVIPYHVQRVSFVLAAIMFGDSVTEVRVCCLMFCLWLFAWVCLLFVLCLFDSIESEFSHRSDDALNLFVRDPVCRLFDVFVSFFVMFQKLGQ